MYQIIKVCYGRMSRKGVGGGGGGRKMTAWHLHALALAVYDLQKNQK